MGTDTAYTLSKGGNPNYVAQVVEVTQLVELEGLDNLRALSTGGFQALVSKDTPIGTRVAVFPAGSRLSDAFASKRNLFRHSEKNADTAQVGYLDDQARVKAIRLRGHRSDALALTVPAGTPIGMFDTIDGDLVVWKYEPPATRSVNTPKADVWKRVESKFLPEHYDTLNYFRYADQIPADAWVTVSQKIHGCFPSGTLVSMWDGTQKKIQDIVTGDVVLGVRDGVAVPSRVRHGAFSTGKTQVWTKLRFSTPWKGESPRTFSTPEHLFLTTDGYREAQSLKVGDTVFTTQNEESPVIAESQVVSTETVDASEIQYSTKWDIETETHNFVAQRMVVHNSSVRLGHIPVRRKLTWMERVLKRFGVHVPETGYDYVAGSRKVIKDPLNPNQNHYYSYDMWTDALLEVKDLIPKNIVLYGELTGWTKDGKAIQKNYTYTAAPNSADLYIYRVSVVTEDAQQYDLPWKQMVAFCEARGLKTVPLLWEGLHSDFEPERWLDTRYWPEYPQAVRLSNEGTVDEGVVIRADLEHGPVALKAKSPVFLRHESTLLDEGTPDMESEN